MMETDRLLTHAFLEAHPEDTALILEGLSPEEAGALLEEVPPPIAAAVLKCMAPLSGTECLVNLAAEQAGAIIAALPLDTAAGLLRRVEPQSQEQLLACVPTDIRTPLRLLLRYPEGTAGALMDPQVVVLPHDITVDEALARIRRAPRHLLYYLYVIERSHTLVGVLNLRELLFASPANTLASVMRPHVVWLPARADRQAIVAHPAWREFHALPVVDDTNAFVGAIRYETLRRLEDDSATGRQTQSVLSLALTLGELYWTGLAELLKGLASLATPQPTHKEPVRETNYDT